jgi:hypothetical protein
MKVYDDGMAVLLYNYDGINDGMTVLHDGIGGKSGGI